MPLTDQLESYWKLDEESGTRVDSHGSNDLADNNTVGFDTGKVGNAAKFILANSESLTDDDNASLRVGTGDFTFAFWYKRTAAWSILGVPLCKGGQQDYTFDDNNGAMRFYTRNGGTFPTATWGSALTTNVFYYVVGWRSSADQKNYLQIDNGAIIEASLGGAPVDNDTAGAFIIGSSSGGSPVDALIDEVGFWKRVLTADERTQLYNGGSGLNYASFSEGHTSSGGFLYPFFFG